MSRTAAPLLAGLQATAQARATTPTNQTVRHGGVHPIFQQLLEVMAPAPSEEELIAADLSNDRDKAGKAHRAQEERAMRLQLRYGTVDGK